MSDDRGFTGREIGAFVAFAVVGTLLGIGAYRIGGNLSGVGSGAVVATTDSVGAVPNGKDLYAANCAACHGAQGQGGVGVALARSKTFTPEQFRVSVLEGKSPDKELTPVMPRFGVTGLGGVPATDAQIDAIYTYVKSLP